MNKITEKSYGLVEDVEDNEAIYTIKIKQEPWVDVIVRYGTIKLNIVEEEKNAQLSFKYGIVSCPDNLNKEDLEKSKDFHTFLGDLLSYIISTAFDTGNYKVGKKPNKSDPIDVQSTPVDDPAEDRP